jgi:exodeoxyribonuclease III
MVKVTTWNVNSVNSRLERIQAFLARESPDYLCLQELKCADEKFPHSAIRDCGYHSAIFGQKSYNGVAVLSKEPVEILFKNFDDDVISDASRTITVRTNHRFDLVCAYVPNGQAFGSEKYLYKMQWLKRAKSFLARHWKTSDSLVLVGDFNIAPDDRDVHDPIAWKEHIHCSTEERNALAELTAFGLIDTFRMHEQAAGLFSWWDYREMSFARNKGLRIDLIYATPPAAAQCKSVRIDRDERRGEKPSDHAPVSAIFDVH